VVEMATSISIIRGIVAIRVNNPMRMSAPKTISQTPTNGAMTAGARNPNLHEASDAKLIWKKKLLYAFGEKDCSPQ
jgi:hypothetical protein